MITIKRLTHFSFITFLALLTGTSALVGEIVSHSKSNVVEGKHQQLLKRVRQPTPRTEEMTSQSQETQQKLATIRAERARIESLLPQFVESLALPGKPYGRFKFHQHQKQPWLLYASQQMLSLTVRHDVWAKLDETKKREWLKLLLSSQDPKTGLFICPVETNLSTDYYRSITLKMARVLDTIDVKPRHPLPKAEFVGPDLASLSPKLEALPWNSEAYGAGSQAGHWAVTRLNELTDRKAALHDDPYVMTIIQFLESHQNPKTGVWGNSPSLEDGMNGLLKTLAAYEMLKRPLPNPRLIVDSVLALQKPDGNLGDNCSPWNAMVLLTALRGQTDYRLSDVQAAGLKLANTVTERRQPDGLYSAAKDGSLVVHAGVRLCPKPMPVADIQGTSQALSILKMVEALFEPATGIPPKSGGIVMFGDSTTATRPGAVEKVYAQRVQETLRGLGSNVIVHNAGVGGNSTRDAMKRFDSDVLRHKPRLIVMQFGLNDSSVEVWRKPPATEPRVSLAEFESNLRTMIEQARQQGAKVILMTTNPQRWTDQMKELYGRAPYHPDDPDGFDAPVLAPYNETMRKLAKELGVPLVDIHDAYPAFAAKHNLTVDQLLIDGMHPTDQGHQLVTELLVPVSLEQLK